MAKEVPDTLMFPPRCTHSLTIKHCLQDPSLASVEVKVSGVRKRKCGVREWWQLWWLPGVAKYLALVVAIELTSQFQPKCLHVLLRQGNKAYNVVAEDEGIGYIHLKGKTRIIIVLF